MKCLTILVICAMPWISLGCGGLLPSSPMPQTPPMLQSPGAGGPIGIAKQGLEIAGPESLWSYAWLSVLLVLFFPQVRKPVASLWSAFFRALAAPLVAIHRKFDSKEK